MTKFSKTMTLAMAILLCTLAASPVMAARQKLTIKGSTTILPVAQVAAEVFMDRAPDVDVSVQGGGSGLGLAALTDSTTTIASSSRAINPVEIAKAKAKRVNPTPTVIAYDGIAVVTHPTNRVKALSLSQLQGIYTGKITNWSSLGGANQKIVVISRDSSSGTFEAFEELALNKQKVRRDALSAASNQAIAKIVAQTPGAIGYVGLGYLTPKVKALPIDGQACNRATVLSKRYPLSRPLYFYTNGKPSGDAKRFIDFVLSSEGQKLVNEEGYVSVRR